MELKFVYIDKFDVGGLVDVTTYALDKYKIQGFALVDEGTVVDILDFYFTSSTKLIEDALKNSSHNVDLYEKKDPRHCMLIDRVLPVAFVEKRLATNVLYSILVTYNYDYKLMNEIFKNPYFCDLIEYCNWVPDIMVNIAEEKYKGTPYKYSNKLLVIMYNMINEALKKALDDPTTNLSKKLPMLAIFNSLTDLERKEYCHTNYNNPYELINELFTACITNMAFFCEERVDACVILRYIESTGEQLKFCIKNLELSDKDKKKMISNVRSMSMLKNAVVSVGFNRDIVETLIYKCLPKLKVSNNKYVSSTEFKDIYRICSYLQVRLHYSPDDEIIIYLKSFICVPDVIEDNRDEQSIRYLTNLMSMSDFNNYYRIVYEYRITKSKLYGINDARYKMNLLDTIVDRRKYIKIAKLIVENINESDLRPSSKKKAFEYLDMSISYHNKLYPEETVDTKDVY